MKNVKDLLVEGKVVEVTSRLALDWLTHRISLTL